MGRHLSPRHGQVMLFRIPRFDHNMDVQYQVAPELPNSLESVRCGPCGADGWSFGRSVYGHVITKLSGMDRFSHPWFSAARASHERELR